MCSPKLTPGSGHEDWLPVGEPEPRLSVNKETPAKTRLAHQKLRFQALVTSPPVTTAPGDRSLELNDRTPCYCAAADSGADASRSQRRADCARMRSKSSGNR